MTGRHRSLYAGPLKPVFCRFDSGDSEDAEVIFFQWVNGVFRLEACNPGN